MKDNREKYWKSVEEFNAPKPFREAAKNEFPESVLDAPSKMSRRNFLSIMGASIAFAGLSGCRKPVEKILPYVNQPEAFIPGIPKYYATTMPFDMNSFGVIVENHEGRPTHIEGNKNHSSSQGATNSFVQASILDLYDPDRSKTIRHGNKRSSWKNFARLIEENKNNNKSIAILSPPFSSPSLSKLKSKLESNKNIDWYCYSPASNENEYYGIESALGKRCIANYLFEKADCILSLDSDFLNVDDESIKNTKGFSKKRKVDNKKTAKMNRLYVVEGNLSATGAMADHRKRLKQSKIEEFVFNLWKRFESGTKSKDIWLESLYQDLIGHKKRSIVKGGPRLSVESHDMIVRINSKLENIARTINYVPLSEKGFYANPSNSKDYKNLLSKMVNGKVDCLIVLDSNPVYFSKNGQNFKQALKKVDNSIHFGMHYDETAECCNWHIPKTHYLESWGDCQSLDGVVSITQPLISPLYNECRSDLDILSLILNPDKYRASKPLVAAYDIVYNAYKQGWKKYLHNGVVKKSKFRTFKPRLKSKDLKVKKSPNAVEVVFYLSGQVYDGRFANNAWLQESPDSISKVTWDNVAILSNSTAKKLNIKNKEIISLKYNEAVIDIPAWILPGHADDQISLQLGYGRNFKSKVAKSVGENVYPLMNGAQYNNSIKISNTNKMGVIACTQDHHGMNTDDSFANNEIQDRLPDIYREISLKEYKKNGGKKVSKISKDKHLKMSTGETKTLYENPYKKYYDAPAKPYNKPYDPTDPPQWGMTIDLNSCTGCNACSIACQSENNIPTVGKEEVLKGREMSWVRLDRYFKGEDMDNPEVAFQPVECMQCENAPCEQVCPVSATVHDEEGLNAMVYNRCIGTRYCSNNCPYKVRRFNFHNYTSDTPEIVQMAHNPDVTIRFRGVMEKCTFCVQRIKEVEHKSKVQKKNLNDFDLEAVCQTACPADCIEFGNIKDSDSSVYESKKSDRNYSLLEQLNTRPRVTYLAKLRNPNPQLDKS